MAKDWKARLIDYAKAEYDKLAANPDVSELSYSIVESIYRSTETRGAITRLESALFPCGSPWL